MTYPVDMTKAVITSQYGWRTNPFTGQQEFHGAVDIAPKTAGEKLPVYAVNNGIVHSVMLTDWGGNMVYILHADGNYSRYLHLDRALVTTGQVVTEGQQIAVMGTTGDSTGVHLDFAVLNTYPERWIYNPNLTIDPTCTLDPIEYLAGASTGPIDPVDPVDPVDPKKRKGLKIWQMIRYIY